jgi:hypothetical protein
MLDESLPPDPDRATGARSTHVGERRLWIDAAPWLLALVAYFSLQVHAMSLQLGSVFWPFTDAFEYASMARWMVAGEGAVLRIGPAFFPARVPPTLSVLLLPQALFADPRDYWQTVFAIGVAAVLGFWRLARALGLGRSGALCAAALLAASPGFASYAGYVMSDVPALALLLLILGCALRSFRRAGDARGALLVAALASGVLVALRSTHAIWLLAIAIVTPAAVWRDLARRPLRLGAALALLAAPLAALALHQWRSFGSPTATGYSFWLDASHFFGLQYVATNLDFYLMELAGVRSEILAQPFGATSDLYVLPVALAGLVGIARVASSDRFDTAARRIFLAAAIGTLATLALFAFVRWHDWRFLMPVAAWVAFGGGALADACRARFGAAGAAVLGASLLLATLVLAVLPLGARDSVAPLIGNALDADVAALRAGGDGARIETTRLPLALTAIVAPRAVVLFPGPDKIGRDIEVELIRKRKLSPLRVDPGYEELWRKLVEGRAVAP